MKTLNHKALIFAVLGMLALIKEKLIELNVPLNILTVAHRRWTGKERYSVSRMMIIAVYS
jgi:hypothetical protein